MQQLLIARAADAEQFRRQYKGCATARKAASGIFNVRIGNVMKADAAQASGASSRRRSTRRGLAASLAPAARGRAYSSSPICRKSNIAPPLPTREQVETMLVNKKYDTYEERYMRELRRNAFIDYKDPNYAQ